MYFSTPINWGKDFTVDNKTGFPIEHDLFHKNVDKNLMLSLKVKHVIDQLKKIVNNMKQNWKIFYLFCK